MSTFYIKMRPPLPEVTFDWANYVQPSKYADARAIRAKHRYAKRKRNRS